jgi:hypothetical protein
VSALERLAAAGIDSGDSPLYIVLDRLMLAASRRGVITNALGSSRSWGPKHHIELKLRRYECVTGREVHRPKTYIARPHEVDALLNTFARRGEACLVKPAFGEGGRGFRIVRPGDGFAPSAGTVVVQQLIAKPLTVEGHKADIRCYVLIDVEDVRASGRLAPIFIRRAAVPYVAQSLPAEITNTSYRSRQGLAPDIRPLERTPGISPALHGHIVSELDELLRRLLAAYFWNAARESANESTTFVPNRRIILGIDVLVAGSLTEPRLYFLETNPFPALYRGTPHCDEAVDDMLAHDYLAAVIGSRTPRSAFSTADNGN